MARPSPSVSDRPIATRPNHPKPGCGYTPSDPAKARPTRARTAETRTVDARGVQKSRGFLRGRHPPLRACLRWTGASESGGRTSARAVATNCRLFSLENVTAWFLSKVAKQWEFSRQKMRNWTKKKLVMYGLIYPRRAKKSVSVLARKHRVQRRRRVNGINQSPRGERACSRHRMGSARLKRRDHHSKSVATYRIANRNESPT